jgi:L-threonylcarbamoyladenylate synthase
VGAVSSKAAAPHQRPALFDPTLAPCYTGVKAKRPFWKGFLLRRLFTLGVDEAVLDEAACCLQNGGLVAFPTDTLYGLAAVASQERAVERLFEAKERPRDRPLPILLASAADVNSVAVEISPAARRLMEAFWPGGMTLVLRRHPGFRSPALAGGDTVAVRVPNHPVAVELLCRVGEPLTGTSANLSGWPGPRTAEEVRHQLGSRVDLIVDGGPCPGGVESTVVDCTVDPPRVLREGAVPAGRVAAVLPAQNV